MVTNRLIRKGASSWRERGGQSRSGGPSGYCPSRQARHRRRGFSRAWCNSFLTGQCQGRSSLGNARTPGSPRAVVYLHLLERFREGAVRPRLLDPAEALGFAAPVMGNALEDRGIESGRGKALDELPVGGLVHLWVARHDPRVFTVRMRDDGMFVIIGQIQDDVLRLEGPDELHAPARVGGILLDEARGRVGLQVPVEAALAELVRGGDAVVFRAIVMLDRVVRVSVDKDRRVALHEPRSHEAVEIDGIGRGQGRPAGCTGGQKG